MQFYYENLYVSSFYASWGETLEALWRGALLEAAPRAAAADPPSPFRSSCNAGGQAAAHHPDPSGIGGAAVAVPDAALRPARSTRSSSSDDDSLHKLRVETYGGASWLTEFSLLAGVSTHAFGGMRQFVQTFTQNKLKDTLPQALERCGYRNVVFYPMMRNFVSNDRFYNSIGLKEIFDMKVARRQDRPGARPLLFRQRLGRDGAALQVVAQAALHLHPDHVGALALRLQVRAGGRRARRRARHRSRRCTSICAASPWPRWTSTT